MGSKNKIGDDNLLDLSRFNENQKRAINFMDGACCVIATAGSGKTATLTYRIANLIEHGVKPENILAVTFSKKASEEMKNRLASLVEDSDEVNIGTFHSICYRILRDEWNILNNPLKDAELAPDWWQKKTVKEIMSPPTNKFPNGINLNWIPRQALSFISFQKNNLISPNDNLIINSNLYFMENKLRKLYKLYEERKNFEKKIDFDDMLIMCYKLFMEYPDILEKYQNMFKYILVDEYQDTNLVQSEILRLLAQKHHNLFVVGDDAQAIYGFRGSNVNLIINFKEDWDAEVIPLDINYRSTANIVEWSNELIKNNVNQIPKDVKPNKDKYQDPVIFRETTEEDEAKTIAREISNLIENESYKPKDFAILYRTNAQSRALEEALMENKIPYVVMGSGNFYKRKEIKDIIAYLKLCVDPHNDLALERIINTPNRYLGKSFMVTLENYAGEHDLSLYEALKSCPACFEWRYKKANDLYRLINQLGELKNENPKDVIMQIRKLTGYDDWLLQDDTSNEQSDEYERIENLNALAYGSSRFDNIQDFLNYIDYAENNNKTKGTEADKVKLMSIHKSKGLEFPVVFIVGVNNGVLPHKNAILDEEIEEERRLFYVAMTRAEKLLYISYTDFYMRQIAGKSDFIKELEEIKKKQEELIFI